MKERIDGHPPSTVRARAGRPHRLWPEALALGALVFHLAACDAAEEASLGGDPLEELVTAPPEVPGAAQQAEDHAHILAAVRLQEHDITIEFWQHDDEEGVAVSELAPVDAPSVLDPLMGEQQATPLEMFMALAPGETPPESLFVDHAALGALRGDAAARVLEPPPPQAYQWSVKLATCTLESDGQSYFDGIWKALGWTFHWYLNRSADEVTGWAYTPLTGYTYKMRSHVCNGGKKDHPTWKIQHRVYRDGAGVSCTGEKLYEKEVPKGYRSLYFQTSFPKSCRYQGWAYRRGSHAYPVKWQMGLMAP